MSTGGFSKTRLGRMHDVTGLQDLHICSVTWKTNRFSAAQATVAPARSCCGTGPSSWPPSAMNSDPVEKLASSNPRSDRRSVRPGQHRRADIAGVDRVDQSASLVTSRREKIA
jgi:predicted small lipoprotein YifL